MQSNPTLAQKLYGNVLTFDMTMDNELSLPVLLQNGIMTALGHNPNIQIRVKLKGRLDIGLKYVVTHDYEWAICIPNRGVFNNDGTTELDMVVWKKSEFFLSFDNDKKIDLNCHVLTKEEELAYAI